jgi:uncharacterized protein YndB with AHSA1/START domain
MSDRRRGEGAIRDEAVEWATGRGWGAWFSVLDAWGAKTKTHREIAKHLGAVEGISPWWAQMITVRYERDRGMRAVGERPGGFELSRQRTVNASAREAFAAFTDASHLSKWFTTRARVDLRAGGKYSNGDGDRGEFLLVEPPKRVKFTWDNPQHCPGTLVEVTFETRGRGKSVVRLTHSRLRDQRAYEDMKEGWSWAMESFKSYLETGKPIPHEAWTAAKGKPSAG